QIIAAPFLKTKSGVGHDCTDRMTADVLPTSVATAVPVETRHRIDRAQFKRLAEDIARRQAAAPMLLPFVSQHSAAQEIAASCSYGQDVRCRESMRGINQTNRTAINTQRRLMHQKHAQGATEMGPCLTDAAPEDRSQRTARVLTAMMPPERMRLQSLRLSWPGGSIRTSMTATATTRILAQLFRLSREQTRAGSIRRLPVNLATSPARR